MKQRSIKTIIAHYQDMMQKIKRGGLTDERAVKDLKPEELQRFLQSESLSFTQDPEVTAIGVGVSSGLAVGKISFDENPTGRTILVKEKIGQFDYQLIQRSAGVIIMKGGMTSPGVLIARSLHIPVVALGGNDKMSIDKINTRLVIGDKVICQGESAAVDGYRGRVMKGLAKISKPVSEKTTRNIVQLINRTCENNVLSFVSSVRQAVEVNKQGFGLGIRSEDLIASDASMLELFQKYILTVDNEKSLVYLKALARLQREQYQTIFSSNQNQPLIIRLFDPPLSEFFPSVEELVSELFEFKESLNKADSVPEKTLLRRKIDETATILASVRNFSEDNKMLGHRGCRFAITHPDLYRSQINAIFLALADITKRKINCCPNISIPMVIDPREVRIVREMVKKEKESIEKRCRVRLTYNLGVAIETPRAVALAEQLATEVDFFSFGTNDLTQLVMGISRTDSNSFLPMYQQQGILLSNPFDKIDFVVANLISKVIEVASGKNKEIRFFAPVKSLHDAKIISRLIGSRGYTVCNSVLAPVIKLSLLH